MNILPASTGPIKETMTKYNSQKFTVPFNAAMDGTRNVNSLSNKEENPFTVFIASSGEHLARNSRSRPFEKNFPSPVVIINLTSLFLKIKTAVRQWMRVSIAKYNQGGQG